MSRLLLINPTEENDLPFLRDMLWEATALSAEMRALGKEIALSTPSVRKYLHDWGRSGDADVIASDAGGGRLGAAWYRLFSATSHSYGFVAPDIPELTIGVIAAARGEGVGSALLQALLSAAHQQGFTKVNLSVNRQNPACALYERYGFRDAGISPPDDTSVTMLSTL